MFDYLFLSICSKSLLVELDNVLERETADRAALTSLGTGDASEVVATGDEGSIALSSVADFAGLVGCGC